MKQFLLAVSYRLLSLKSCELKMTHLHIDLIVDFFQNVIGFQINMHL